MKIISALLIALVTLPLGINLASSYVSDFRELLPGGDHASLYSFSDNISSQPVLMILMGIGLIGIAGLGRKKLSNRDNDKKNQFQLKSVAPPYPDPVPWKKEK